MVLKLLSVSSVFLFLSSCSPLGYMQSPRVMPGVEITSHGKISFSDSGITTDIEDMDSEGYPRTYCSWGIFDRVRISGGAVGGEVTAVYGDKYVAGDLMVNILDRGQPRLFKNIAVGGLLSGEQVVKHPTDYENQERKEKNVTAGALVSTGGPLFKNGKIELIGGLGITSSKLEQTEWVYENRTSMNTPGAGTNQGTLHGSAFYTDVSSSIQFYFSEKRFISAIAGVSLSVLMEDESWFTSSDNTYETYYSQQLPEPDIGFYDVVFKVQGGVSVRFGGKKQLKRMKNAPRGAFVQLSQDQPTAQTTSYVNP